MRIAVCDDDLVFMQSLAKRLDALSKGELLVNTFSNASDLIRVMTSGRKLDAVFLDIEMPGLNGLDAARKLRELGGELSIVFLTSHTELAMEGYEVDALRFLSKDCSDKKLIQALEAIERELGAKPNVVIKQTGEEYVIAPQKIILAEISARMKLTEALQMLNEASGDFVKVHRCTIVNLRHVMKYTAKEILLDNGETVPMSKSCAAEFKAAMFDFVRLSAR